ncbi:tRNA 2-thiouridine(34) synthase MnmA [bacterium]|nr:tRNA 2-thiouridine(34) synthase MnmA [bacterium]
MRILVAISGGVDSAVSAYLLKKAGHEVLTAHFLTSERGASAAEDAKRVAAALGVQCEIRDLRERFEETVVKPFVEEYLRARTPNPCVNCNPNFKFRELLSLADEMDCEMAATGHYARIERDENGRAHLMAAANLKKDQSYFLSRLGYDQISRIIFPLGGMTKDEVREIAAKAGIPVAQKRDSQEICFIPNDDYEAFLKERAPESFEPGVILDTNGREAGSHVGLPAYTIGQRKKIGAHCVRKYVVRLDKAENLVVIGDNEDLLKKEVLLEDMAWLQPPRGESFPAECKIRSTSLPKKCGVKLLPGGKALIEFAEPERAVTPGQAGVVYLSGEVLGEGTISG